MYYILNETEQIIAADDHFLHYVGVAHINELSVKLAKGELSLEESDDGIVVLFDTQKDLFTTQKITFSSLIGNLTLVSLQAETPVENTDKSTPAVEDTGSLELTDLTLESEAERAEAIPEELGSEESEELISLLEEETESTITLEDHLLDDEDTLLIHDETDKKDENSEANIKFPEDEELFTLTDEAAIAEEEQTSQADDFTADASDDDLLDLGLEQKDDTDAELLDLGVVQEDETDNTLLDLGLDQANEEKSFEDDTSEIVIDSFSISQKIGISEEDYKNFLNDFIDTALSLEKDLQSSDNAKREEAISTLSHLSDVLHLPVIGKIIADIKTNHQANNISAFYSALSRLTTSKSDTSANTQPQEDIEQIEILHEPKEEHLELFDEPPVEPETENETTQKPTNNKSFGTISLDDVTPKHFDFQLEEAANDLSLPVELIEEFVHDFIEQAHVETKKMLQAYEEGNLETIQKIGHLLKGASSNLRINPLSETLYKIQFCENPDDLEGLIKDYWAHFLAFETQINAISH